MPQQANRCVNEHPEVLTRVLADDGTFPNSFLPVLLYKHVVETEDASGELIEQVFSANEWKGSWRNGIYTYHHYHSTSHEVLGVYRGSAKVRLGGENGVSFELAIGDMLVIPAGVAHKNLGASSDFAVVGAYPEGMQWDMNYGRPGERPRADENIARVPVPNTDPIYGKTGPLLKWWPSR